MAERVDNLSHLAGQISRKDLERLNGRHTVTEETPLRRQAAANNLRDLTADPAELIDDTQFHLEALRHQALQRRQAARERLIQRKTRTGTFSDQLDVVVLIFGVLVAKLYAQVYRVKRWWDRQPALMRGATMITVSLVTLAFVGFFFAGEVRAYLEGDVTGPVLDEALTDPYALDLRPMPSLQSSAESLLPRTLGDFTRTDVEFTADSTSTLMNHCILGIQLPFSYANECVRTVGHISAGSARYMGSSTMVDVAVIKFPLDHHAERTMEEVLHYAREIGQVGNFAVANAGSVNYMYSQVRGWVSFTWQRGPWIFSVSATSFQALEDAVAAFGY